MDFSKAEMVDNDYPLFYIFWTFNLKNGPEEDPCHYRCLVTFKIRKEIWLYDPRVPAEYTMEAYRTWPQHFKECLLSRRSYRKFVLYGTQTTEEDCGQRVVDFIKNFIQNFYTYDIQKKEISSLK